MDEMYGTKEMDESARQASKKNEPVSIRTPARMEVGWNTSLLRCDTDDAPRLSSAARIFGHIAFDIESCHFGHTVGAHRNGLLEMAKHTSLSLVGNLDFAFLSRHDGLLGVVGYRTATAWHHLIDDQRLFSGIGENECILLRGIFLGERAEVVAYLVELDAGSLLCFHDLKTQYRQECYQ